MIKKLSNKITLINIISSFALQICTIISGFIIPKIILSNFGSDINGLVSSLNQFLSYIALMEGGVSAVIMANLYKPLNDNNDKKISSIMKTAQNFYNKIGIIFIIYTLFLAGIYPIIFHTKFSYIYIYSLTLILSMNLFIQYMFSLTYKNLLNADKKIFIVSISQIFIIISNIILAILSVKIYPNIHFLKLITGIVYIIQPIIYGVYIKKHYNIDNTADKDNELLKRRWDGFAINIAAFIHNGTDIAVLTIFTNLSTVSIYSVYALVSNGLKQIINSITSGINPTIGNTYASGNIPELNEKIDLYEYIIFFLVFLIFTIGALLITPFVQLYTLGINDTNYNQPIFGILILISEAIYLLKFPHLNLAYSANKFKEITIPAFIEAFLNIVISIILVPKLGIIGVAIGTIVAMAYRLVFHINYTKKIIKSRNQWIFYKKLIIFILTTLVGLIVCYFVPPVEITILSWFIHALIYIFIFLILYFIASLIFFKKELIFFKNYLFKRKRVN